jgi:hypothetical protein
MTSTRPARFILLAIFLLAVALSPMFGAMAQEPTATPTPESLTLTQESGGIAIEQALVDELRIDSTTANHLFRDQPGSVGGEAWNGPSAANTSCRPPGTPGSHRRQCAPSWTTRDHVPVVLGREAIVVTAPTCHPQRLMTFANRIAGAASR